MPVLVLAVLNGTSTVLPSQLAIAIMLGVAAITKWGPQHKAK